MLTQDVVFTMQIVTDKNRSKHIIHLFYQGMKEGIRYD